MLTDDLERRIRVLGGACSAGEAYACEHLGHEYSNRTPADEVRAARAYERACRIDPSICD
jgi:hypothetical protein